ncbi:MAG: translation initiation factor IF-2, partial [Tannerella sp.]|nr:translation initiation factor IF-2 [Tannerella sp.]
MPVKLNKVIKDLNVGLTTVVEYLSKKGHEVESNPNVKITDEQLDLLINEFGKSLSTKEKIFIKPVYETPLKEKPKPQEIEEIKTKIPDDFKFKIVTKGKIDLDEKTFKPKFPFPKAEDKGSGVLSAEKTDEANKSAIEKEDVAVAETPVENIVASESKAEQAETDSPAKNPVPEVDASEVVAEEKKQEVKSELKQEAEVKQEAEQEQIPNPKPEQISEMKQKEIPDVKPDAGFESKPEPLVEEKTILPEEKPAVNVNKEKVEEKLFRLAKPHLEPNIKVTGKIDLSAINQATSPRKKTKEEKKRERDERKVKFMEQRKAHSTQANKTGEPKSISVKPAAGASSADGGNKHKRKRIRKERVDINKTQGTNTRKDEKPKQRIKRPVRVAVNEGDVQKQIKETLARLTNKNSKGKAAKYRREKRDAAAH